MIDFTPTRSLSRSARSTIRWYGIAYVVAIVAGTWLATHEARRRGERTDIIVDALIVIAVAALSAVGRITSSTSGRPGRTTRITCPDRPAAVQRSGHLRRPVHRVAGHDLADPPLQGQLLALGRHHGARDPAGPGRRPLGQFRQPGAVRPADDAAVGHCHPVPVPGCSIRLPGRLRSDRDARPALHPALPLRVAVEPGRHVRAAVAVEPLHRPRPHLDRRRRGPDVLRLVRPGADFPRTTSERLGLGPVRSADGADTPAPGSKGCRRVCPRSIRSFVG
jgi:hypothetical protein